MIDEFDLTCIDEDGKNYSFTCEFEKNSIKDEWRFRVYAIPPPLSGEFFELTITAVNQSIAKITMIDNHREEAYRGKSIPESLLPIASNLPESVSLQP